MTGGLDEVQIEAIQTHYEKLNETAKRKRNHHQHHSGTREDDSGVAKAH